jgi:hypothetical protein
VRRIVGPALLVLITGCATPIGGADRPPSTGTNADAASSPLPTSTYGSGPSASQMGAPLSGELVVDVEGCVRLATDPGQLSDGLIDLVWPNGATAVVLSSGQVSVVLSDGREFTRTGEHVRFSGGFVQPSVQSDCFSPDRAVYEAQQILG